MEPPITGHDAISRDNRLMRNWRVPQLTRLGLPRRLASPSEADQPVSLANHRDLVMTSHLPAGHRWPS
jgi:hypothetical protein